MSKKRKRRKLKPGSVTSYKLPVIKDEEEKKFYKWINNQDSINGIITESLKLKFMIDNMKIKNTYKDIGSTVDNKSSNTNNTVKNIESNEKVIDVADVGDIDILDDENVDVREIMKTIKSVKR